MEMVSVMSAPRVSVLMTVYNSEKYLAEAIESILAQTYTNFEFLIIDDASTDKSPQILAEFALRDPRIQYEILPQNRGIGVNRSILLQRAVGEYVAIMDSDDISMPERLALQLAYLDEHRECAVVGGQLLLIRESGDIFWKRMYSASVNSSEILKRSPVAQPASFFRKEVAMLAGGYREKMEVAEDYDLWLRIFAGGGSISNIDSFVLKYRITLGQSKAQKLKKTLLSTLKCQMSAMLHLGIRPSPMSLLYFLMESILLLFPSRIILSVFEFINYKSTNELS